MSELVSESQSEIDKLNEKKQSDLLARREARRRRILENAKSRLDKLSGTDRDGSPTNKCRNHTTETYPDPEIEYPEHMNNYPTYNATVQSDVDWTSSPLLSPPNVPPPTKFEKFLTTRTHIVAASALTYTLLVLGLHAIISQSLFVLFLAVECVELVIFRRERPLSPIVNMLLMLSGMNIAKAGILIKLFGILHKMLSDLGLFVFSFIISHGIYCIFAGGETIESFNSF